MDAEKYDLILEFILRKENVNSRCNASLIKRDLFPELNTDQINNLIDEMESINSKVFNRLHKARNKPIEPNGLTQLFLDDGGFRLIKKNLIIKKQENVKQREKETKLLDLEVRLAKSNIEANKLNKRVAKINKKNESKNMIATWLNVLFALINIGIVVWQALKD
ncbi:hypothetical protein [Ichthyenterobacterium magnum]|uniref:Uncharacterized protein n=1 Tax=Ichthyenterobacterium magnum TaxID=1230530 RepID=A0A420DEN2_9FLAO|nr:hypothetical protein [Ichthyenterobacterium magnum]RKE90262.1 hypothetical protein BXY80_2729 [Ichthyenterobacterium magnum]